MFSKIIRRTHMYIALFLAPWVLMYAASTILMNHRAGQHGGPPVFAKERELVYDGTFPAGATPRAMALQILAFLDMDGAHGVPNPGRDAAIVINRFDPVSPRRITFTPADGRIVVERQAFRTPAFLERLHRRRGFQHDYPLEDTWAFSVDLVIVAIAFWVFSGLWMWWEMKLTRRLGALCLAGGAALLAVFVLAI